MQSEEFDLTMKRSPGMYAFGYTQQQKIPKYSEHDTPRFIILSWILFLCSVVSIHSQ